MNRSFLILGLVLSYVFSCIVAFGQEADDDDLLIEEVEPVKVERNRFDKEKWDKKKYDRFDKRRKASGLPEKLAFANDETLARDPLLGKAALSTIIYIPESKALLTEKMAVYVNLLPEQLPDTNILFNDANISNAFAVGTGQIVLPAGIIKDLKTEDAVMFVLAHELAHIAMDHFKAEENRKMLNEGVTVVSMVANDMNKNKAAQSDELMGYMIFSEKLLGPSWSKSNEKSADELAIDLIVRAGYSIESARDVIRSFVLRDKERERQLAVKCGGKKGFGRAFGNVIQATFTGKMQQQKPLPAECSSYKSGFLGGLFSSKKSSDKRLEEFAKYVNTRYPTYQNPKPTEFTGVLQRDFAEDGTLQRTVYASESILAMQAGRYQLAAQYALASWNVEDQNTVKPRLAMYSLLQKAGRRDEALTHLNIALASPQASSAVYTFAIRERLSDAYTLAAMNEQSRINEIVNDIFTQYGSDNMAALAAAQETHERIEAEENAYWERDERPPEYNPADYDLSPDAITAYEVALELTRTAQMKFPDAPEFLLTEIEILRTLKRQEELIQRLEGCRNSEDKGLRAICKMAVSV